MPCVAANLFAGRSFLSSPFNLLKILHLNDTDNWAGTESHILDLATALRAQGDDAAIACPPHSPLAARAHAIPVLPLEINKLIDRRAIQKLARLLKSGRADVLHAHNGRTQLHGALAVAAARRGTLVWTQHFIAPRHAQSQGRKAALMKRVHRAVNARTHGFIAISNAVKCAMIERGEASLEQIVVVPNGIGDPRAAKLEDATIVRARYVVAPDAPLVVSLCRLEREKDVATLLRAWARLEVPGARLLLAGRGAQSGELQRQIERDKLTDSAQLVGFVEEPLSLLNAADVLAHSAPAEPFGLVFLEAMGLAKPIVACRGGAAPEIINSDCGVLITHGDEAATATALRELLRDKTRAHSLGRGGRVRFEAHFTRERMAENTLEVYREALKR